MEYTDKIYWNYIKIRSCLKRLTNRFANNDLFLLRQLLVLSNYFLAHMSAINQSLSGLVINRALLYAISIVNMVLPS